MEIVFQGSNVVAGTYHPMHLHGHSFYVVGWGFGNFDENSDPLRYNLVDPPLQNTVSVPKNGWVAIRFEASNPGMLQALMSSIKKKKTLETANLHTKEIIFLNIAIN